jgi:hypothetical protein
LQYEIGMAIQLCVSCSEVFQPCGVINPAR